MDKKIQKTGGNLKISNDVIVKIAVMAASEISGVALEGRNLACASKSVPFAKNFTSPIKVKINGESVEIDIKIIVIQGFKAINVAGAVQNSVKSAVQNMTGIAVSKVNVKIAGILLNKEEAS